MRPGYILEYYVCWFNITRDLINDCICRFVGGVFGGVYDWQKPLWRIWLGTPDWITNLINRNNRFSKHLIHHSVYWSSVKLKNKIFCLLFFYPKLFFYILGEKIRLRLEVYFFTFLNLSVAWCRWQQSNEWTRDVTNVYIFASRPIIYEDIFKI